MYIEKELVTVKKLRGFKASLKKELEFKRDVEIKLICKEINKRFYWEHIETMQGYPRWQDADRVEMIYYYMGLLRLVANGNKKEITDVWEHLKL